MSKYCLITGASSGIGEEFAYIFAKNNLRKKSEVKIAII